MMRARDPGALYKVATRAHRRSVPRPYHPYLPRSSLKQHTLVRVTGQSFSPSSWTGHRFGRSQGQQGALHRVANTADGLAYTRR